MGVRPDLEGQSLPGNRCLDAVSNGLDPVASDWLLCNHAHFDLTVEHEMCVLIVIESFYEDLLAVKK
jgi:hypothetical protein